MSNNHQPSAKEIKEALLAETVRREPMTVAGKQAYLHGLSSFEMEHFRALANSDDPAERAKAPAKLVQMSLRAADGTPVFTAKEIAIVAARPDSLIVELAAKILRLNGYGFEAAEAIAKNLPATPGDSGSSDSPGSKDAVQQNS